MTPATRNPAPAGTESQPPLDAAVSPNANRPKSEVFVAGMGPLGSSLLSLRDLALVDAVALRVVELLDARRDPRQLVDAETLAARLGISRSTVYDHAAELGAVEVGTGQRPRLRFDPQMALEAWTRRSSSGESQQPLAPVSTGDRGRRRRQRLGSTVDLLPVKGQEAA